MRRVLCVGASALVLALMTSAVFAQDAEVVADTAPAVAEAEYELPTIVVGTDASKSAKKRTSSAPQAQSAGSPSSTAASSQKQNPSGTASSGSVAGGGAETDQTADVDASADGAGASGNGAAGDAGGSTTGTPSSGRIVEQATTLTEVTAGEIAQRGAKSLDEAIEMVPGLYVRNGGDGVPRIDIRGLRTRNVTLLLDGVPLNSTFDGQFDPRSIPVENIARIKVTRGASSVLYGPGGNAAVIDIITKGAAPGLHGTAQVEYGGPEQYKANATASYGSEKFSFFASGSTFDQDYFNLSGDFDTTQNQPEKGRVNSDRRDDAAYANLSFAPNANAKFGLSLNYREGEYGKPPATLTQNESIYASRTRFERVEDYETFGIQATAALRFNEVLTIRPSAFYNVLDELTANYDDATFQTQDLNRAFESDARTEIYGGGIQTLVQFNRNNLLTATIDARHEGWDAGGFEVGTVPVSVPAAPNPTRAARLIAACAARGGTVSGPTTVAAGIATRNCNNVSQDFTSNHGIDVFSTAVEHETKLTQELSAVAGAGYARQDRAEASDEDYTWLLGLKYAFNDDTFLRGAVARKIRFPTLRDLYEIGRANPDLETETTMNYEAGGGTAFFGRQLVVGVTLFQVDAKDFIEADDNGIAQNNDEYRFRGVETELRFSGIQNLLLTAAHTYMESENLSSDADTKELQNRPEHKVTLTANYQLGWGISFNASYLYITGSKALSRTAGTGGGGGGGGGGIVLPDTTQVLELDDYHVVNLGLSKEFWDGQAELYGRLENVLDENYEHSFGFPEPGRAAYVGFKVKL